MRTKLKPWLTYTGWVIVCLAFVFLGHKAWTLRAFLAKWRPNGQTLGAMFLGMMIYAGASGLLAVAWFKLVQYWSPNAPFKGVFSLYARTQIAKYIPGNIFHLAGRWMGGYQMGVSHRAILGATVYEMAGMLVVTMFIAAHGFLTQSLLNGVLWKLSAGAVLLGLVGFPFMAIKVAAWLMPRLPIANWPVQTRLVLRQGFIPAYFSYVLTFLLFGLLFTGWTWILSGVGGFNKSLYIISVFSTAWLVGFILPGASGGLGVREAIIVGLLGCMVGEAQSLLIALSFRLVTVGGDFLFFILSFVSPSPRLNPHFAIGKTVQDAPVCVRRTGRRRVR